MTAKQARTERLEGICSALPGAGVGAAVFVLLAHQLGAGLPVAALLVGGLAGVLAVAGAFFGRGKTWRTSLPISLATAGCTVVGLATLYQLAAFTTVSVDVVSFAESPFVNDILKAREGLPIYTPATDNNSYPYTPGAPLLTWAVAAMFGKGDSIVAYRIVQLSYVLLAALFAALAVQRLAGLAAGGTSLRSRWAWLPASVMVLLAVAWEPRFNLYTHSLHNDGLSLLICSLAFWVMSVDATRPGRASFAAMTLLPAAGFFVKQSLVIWAGLFALYLFLHRGFHRRLIAFVALTSGAILAVVGLCYLLWGDPFVWWVFRALGDKQVALERSLLNLAVAGGYIAMSLAALSLLVTRPFDRRLLAIWVPTFLLLMAEGWSSGIGFAANHLGPGILLATTWFLVLVARYWPSADSQSPRDRSVIHDYLAALILICVLGGLGLIRDFRSPVPPDLDRYVEAIEREFEGLAPSDVLLDNGTWIYLRDGVLMKDRSSPVALQVGANQEINRGALERTIERIQNREYRRILAHELMTDRSPYDFGDRGSGVKTAILENYVPVRRIPGVIGVGRWWPLHIIGDIEVLEPAERADSLKGSR